MVGIENICAHAKNQDMAILDGLEGLVILTPDREILGHYHALAGSVSAITFGHIVLAACEQSLLTTHTHERAHVCQYERWGVLFFPAYARPVLGFG